MGEPLSLTGPEQSPDTFIFSYFKCIFLKCVMYALVHVGVPEGSKKPEDVGSPGAGLAGVCENLTGMLGSKFRSSAGAARTLTRSYFINYLFI